jgi:energy-coupling factor transport system ATP-binding protein
VGLSLEGVSFAYPLASPGQVEAVRDVSFALDAGELVLVLGATGSGKSTLLRLLAGLLAPTEGRALIDGEPLAEGAARGRVGLVFQDPESQLFAETLADDAAFGPRNLGASREDARQRALEALARVGLPAEQFAARSPFALSGGEARRAAIAGILAMRPDYLLLDEPTAGLDANGRRAIREIVSAERRRSGVAVVSHSATEFLPSASRVVLLSEGRIVFDSPAAEAVADPAIFSRAGIAPPDVLAVQQLAAARGAALDGFTLDVTQTARALAQAARRRP